MAMVFSVQQGEHGPLVTYKLEVTNTVKAADPIPADPLPAGPIPADVAPLQAAAPAAPKLGPLEPRLLGTVTIPAERATAAPRPAARSVDAERLTNGYQRLFRSLAEQPEGPALLHAYTGEAITLDQVNAELEWRRETAEKLRRRTPFAPRF